MDYIFPIFRKYGHDNTYFRINSKENFDELMIIGSFFIFKNQQAQIFPEFTMIIDMIENQNNNWHAISADDFDAKLTLCQENLTEKKL